MDYIISETFEIQLNTNNKENGLSLARRWKTHIHILKESKKVLWIKHTLLDFHSAMHWADKPTFLLPLQFCTALLTTSSSLVSCLGYSSVLMMGSDIFP
jgi:hypothetical protein